MGTSSTENNGSNDIDSRFNIGSIPNDEGGEKKARCRELECINEFHLFWLQETEKMEEYLRKEIERLEKTAGSAHAEAGAKCNELETLQDEVSHQKMKVS